MPHLGAPIGGGEDRSEPEIALADEPPEASNLSEKEVEEILKKLEQDVLADIDETVGPLSEVDEQQLREDLDEVEKSILDCL